MAGAGWTLQRGYASLIYPGKGLEVSDPPSTYALKLENEFRQALSSATTEATRRPLSAIVLQMSDKRQHPVRELLMKLAFGQTRTPLPAVTELASRLVQCTDKRTGTSLLVTTVEEDDDRRRVTLYLFPEEDTYALRSTKQEPTEAFLERLSTFVLQSRLRKVARFQGKDIKSHFLQGEVVDLQIGSDPRTAADYWVTAFLQAEFAITTDKGTRLVAAGLKKAFEKADFEGKQTIMEAASALMANSRQAWSLEKIADDLIPPGLRDAFCSVSQNPEALKDKFLLNKELLRDRINYRVFELEEGVWVSSPFHEVGKSVKLRREGGKRTLTAHGVVLTEKVQRDAKKPRRD